MEQVSDHILSEKTAGVPAIHSGQNNLFPVFLKLEELHVLLVGAGKVGLEKLQALLSNAPSTRITIVATIVSKEVKQLAASHSLVDFEERPFVAEDLVGKNIAVIAVNDREVSGYITALAKKERILVNVADTPDQCDFYLGSIVQKGQLKIAISTNGQSPTVAKRIKEVLHDALPGEIDEVIVNLHKIRNKLNGNFNDKVKKLNALTKVLIEKDGADKGQRWRRIATYSVSAFALMLIGHFIFSYVPIKHIGQAMIDLYGTLDKSFPLMILAGFLAQLVDGALGMGYGVTSATILLSAGINLAAISGSIHTAEMFASGASGYSHYKFGNVNKKLFKILVIPGIIGAILGAVLLSKYGDTHAAYLKPLMAVYTLFLGAKIIITAFREQRKQKKFKHYGALAGAGGFLDSFGGGGWGPIVTTTLITKGRTPRFVIGTVSITEFFVTLASAFTFFTMLGVTHWQVIVALIIGGTVAAPIAAKLAGKLPRKTSFMLVGLLVIIWSFRILYKVFF